jgi:hypothetical protein
MKVFDCTDMPEDVQKKFYDETRGYDNDIYLKWIVLGEQKAIVIVKPEDCCYLDKVKLKPYNGKEIYKEEILSGIKYIMERGDDIIGDWLHDNGAKICEEVIINHWW